MITPVIINRLQWKAYLIFMATNLAFVPIFYYFYPETSNFGLEDIDFIFTDGRNPVTVALELQMRLGSGANISRRPSLVQVQSQVETAESIKPKSEMNEKI